MRYAKSEETGDFYAPSKVIVGENSAFVWLQQRWDKGKYKEYINKNGCGHCCTATALGLHGIDINPHQEYEKCRELWGEPDESRAIPQGHYMSLTGIAKILRSFGVNAECFGMDFGEEEKVKKHISSVLFDGKQVIFVSEQTDRIEDNPFSNSLHYVLAVGYINDNGDILVANSSVVKAPTGVQITDIDTIIKALVLGSNPRDKTWGDSEFFSSFGYVVVG